MSLRNDYWLLRHGRSLANEAEIIVSKLENGIDERWTLAPVGEEQAKEAGRKLREALLAPQWPGRPVLIISSPFSRTLRTAALAAEAAGLTSDVQVALELRERFFGEELELQSYGAAYGKVWERDERCVSNRPGGNGEAVREVSERVRQLFKRLEAEHTGAVVVLVSHGDTLSILQATMLEQDTRQHRRFAFNTAELRPLVQEDPAEAA